MYTRAQRNSLRMIYVTFVVCMVIMFVVSKVSSRPHVVQKTIDVPTVTVVSTPGGPFFLGYQLTDEDLECLALTIYHEARGEEPDGMYAVADVVMYRAMHFNFPDTVCGVVKAGNYSSWNPAMPRKWECAFTWYCDRNSDEPRDLEAYSVAIYVAKQVLHDVDYVPVVPYALYYHADYVYPVWAKTKTRVARVGTHIYYM